MGYARRARPVNIILELDPRSYRWLARSAQQCSRALSRGGEEWCAGALRDGPWPSAPRVQVMDYDNA